MSSNDNVEADLNLSQQSGSHDSVLSEQNKNVTKKKQFSSESDITNSAEIKSDQIFVNGTQEIISLSSMSSSTSSSDYKTARSGSTTNIPTSCSSLSLRTKTVVPPSIETIMDPSIIEMMSSALTDVIMHSEFSYSRVLHMASDHNPRRNPKRNKNCVSRSLSLTMEVPSKKASEEVVDGSTENNGEGDEDEENEVSSLSEAILCKYLRTASTVLEDVPYTSSVMIITPPRTPSLPATLVLNDCDICCVGELEQIEPMCRHVRELDLAQNRLNDLCEVQKIFSLMNRLTFLNLSSNDLSLSGNLFKENIVMDAMKWLVLNNTYIPCESVELILGCMPNLQELYLSLNGYSRITLDENKPTESINLVHISGNPITNWVDVIKLGQKFPNLESLVMADCHVDSFGEEEYNAGIFEKLQSFNISNNRIGSWIEIEKLRLFPSLTDLRLLGLPLLEQYNQQVRRQLVIARLPNTERLNGSRISDLEREDAERAFIRYYMSKQEKPRRYDELIDKHGRLDPLANVDLRPKKVIQVAVQFEDKRELRHINVQQTVGAFKSSLQKFAGIAPNQMRLWYVDAEIRDYTGPEELRFNTKMLYTLNVQDGDEFHIIKKE